MGVGFAVLLIFMELGFLNALLDSTVEVVQRMDGDLILVSRARFAMLSRQRFNVQRIQQARACEGVESVLPVYIEDSAILRQAGRRGYPIRVFAFGGDPPALNIPRLREFAGPLDNPDTALADTKSKPNFGFRASEDDLDRKSVV